MKALWTVSKEFSFEAAHSLPHLPVDHKCRNLHGHSYRVVLICEGNLQPGHSWVIDYADITTAAEPLFKKLDHQNLNNILTVPTTAENLAQWIHDRLRIPLPLLTAVEVKETDKTSVVYRFKP